MKDLSELVEHSDNLAADAGRVEEIHEQKRADQRQAARGNVRTACDLCGGEFYVSKQRKDDVRYCGPCGSIMR